MGNCPEFDGLKEGAVVLTAEGRTVVLGKVLGSGGFGRVFDAKSEGRMMAVKSVRQTTENIKKKTQAEIAVLKISSSSTYTPEFYSSTASGEITLIFMELMGPSLRDIMNRNQKTGQYFSTSDNLKIGNQICQAIAYLNSIGYAHRDIKPGNVCLCREDPFKVKLVDLGEVCRIEELNAEDKRVGTCTYSSPQVLNGLPLDEKLDIWSVGCLLAELILGEKLFPGRNDAEVYWFHTLWGLRLPLGTPHGRFTSYLENADCHPVIDENRHRTMVGHICKGRDISTFNAEEQTLVKKIMKMLEFAPKDRPSAADLCV